MAPPKKVKTLEWYQWCVLVVGIMYSVMNTTSVLMNAFACFITDANNLSGFYNNNLTYQQLPKSADTRKCFEESFLDVVAHQNMTFKAHPIWGSMSTSFLALPGLFLITQSDGPILDGIILLIKTCTKMKLQYCLKFFIYAILLFCYPMTLFLTQLTTMLTNDAEWFNVVMLMMGLEAFFHSLPQFLLQLFMIIYGFKLTITQLLLLIISFALLLTNSVRFDVIANQTKFKTVQDMVVYGCRILPQHVTGIVFRCCSIVLTLAFLRYWGFVAIGVYIIEIMLVAGLTIAFDWNVMYNMGLTNIGNVNVGIVTFFTDKSTLPEDLKSAIKKFVRITTIITFLHHLILIIMIVLSVNSENCIWPFNVTNHWATIVIFPRENLIKRNDIKMWFYLLITNLIGVGIINLILTLYESRNIDIVLETKDETKNSTRNSLEIRLASTQTRSTRIPDSFTSITVDDADLT
jgi:hypothetical protein